MQLVKGKSVSIGRRVEGLEFTQEQVNQLNEGYWDAIEANPTAQIVADAGTKGTYIRDANEFTLWLGIQHGELRIESDATAERGMKLRTATIKATEILKTIYGLSEGMAKKYIIMNENGYFDSEKNDSIIKHWFRRTGINLRTAFKEA